MPDLSVCGDRNCTFGYLVSPYKKNNYMPTTFIAHIVLVTQIVLKDTVCLYKINI